MGIDYNSQVCDAAIVFPDVAFAALPREQPILDEAQLGGSSGTTVTLEGSIES